uniref:Uncharacterized protein n=1 Tax=Panagrolaimus sp. PS1159 TaxID=55785 RepID=A0AC35FXH8_9BILA
MFCFFSLQKQSAPTVPQKPSKQPITAPTRSQYSIVGTNSSNSATSDSSTPISTKTNSVAGKKIGPQSLLNWSEVNSEIKTRQRVAKVCFYLFLRVFDSIQIL